METDRSLIIGTIFSEREFEFATMLSSVRLSDCLSVCL